MNSYCGDFKNGKRDGDGVIYSFVDKDLKLLGKWKDDKMVEGKGIENTACRKRN